MSTMGPLCPEQLTQERLVEFYVGPQADLARLIMAPPPINPPDGRACWGVTVSCADETECSAELIDLDHRKIR